LGFARRRRALSEGQRKRTVETRDEKSAPSSFSAHARSSGTCARCSRSWRSAPADNSARRCPTPAERPCRS